VIGESGFEAQAVSGYSGVCFQIKFSGRHSGFDGVLFNVTRIYGVTLITVQDKRNIQEVKTQTWNDVCCIAKT